MIEVICRYICDRCGKEFLSCEDYNDKSQFVSFTHGKYAQNAETFKYGLVCEECYKDFCELAESFFDDLNKTEKGGEE